MTTPTVQTIRAQLAAAVGGEGRLASFYTQRTMRDLNARAARELDTAAQWAFDTLGRIAAALDREGLAAHARDDMETFVPAFVRAWAAWQHAGSQVANWMVTGPAKFPVARNNKRIATEDRRYAELKALADGAPARAVKRARGAMKEAIGTGGLIAAELADLRQRLAARERKHAMMKAANAIIRRAKLTGAEGDAQKLVDQLAAEGHPFSLAHARVLLEPDCMGGRGFARFGLANNSAEIRRLTDRVAQVERKAAACEAVETGEASNATRTVGDCEIVENRAEDRLQLIFPGKPDATVRGALKSNGFRWSPRNGAWQRQLTNSARAAAERILSQRAA